MSIYGERIKEMREKTGLDVAKLAFRCGWKRSRLANYELGIRKPKPAEIEIISDALKPFLGDYTSVYIITGKTIAEIIGNYSAPKFKVEDAVSEFNKLTSKQVAEGRMKLEPGLKVDDLTEQFSKACGAYLE